MTAPSWIDLEGADNVRDLAGLRTATGETVQPGRLIRSDSLHELTPADIRELVDRRAVTAVVDLRTDVEVHNDGPGPLVDQPAVTVAHLSLFPDTPAAGTGGDEPVVLPWTVRDAAATDEQRRRGAAGVYLRYLDERPDSILAALRLIASTSGATVVHCAAGKDRTGVVVAFALSEVGVERPAIVADYVASAERVERILSRLAGRRTYAGTYPPRSDDAAPIDPAPHRPRAETMRGVLDAVDEIHGGPGAWLRSRGWTDADADALRAKLLEP